MDDFFEINLSRLTGAVLKKWWLILSAAIFFGTVTFVYTVYFIKPMYQTNISVYVNNIGDDTKKSDTISATDLSASQRLVNTYVTIITSNTLLDKVAANIGYIYNAPAIRAMMSCAAVKDTEIFNVVVINENPEVAALIANTIAEVAIAEIPQFLEGSSVKIVDYATIPEKTYTPDIPLNLIKGLAAGMLLAVLVVAAFDIFDKRIKSEDDLIQLSDIPVLGTVPDFLDNKKNGCGYGYYSRDKGSLV